jgi:ribA/ribD-fused uncharacterized protein
MSETAKIDFDPNMLNVPGIFLWFDDLGTNNPHAFLSNFWAGEPLTVPTLDSAVFPTGEHLFAAFKARTLDGFLSVLASDDPNEAKHAGRTLELRDDWEAVKYDAMRVVLGLKFTLDREEGRKLLDTGDAYLCEGTFWEDEVWGVDLNKDRADGEYPGRNWLGVLLMARRAELRAAEQGFPTFNTIQSSLERVLGGDFLAE